MDITGMTPTEAPSGMHTYVCPACGKTVYCATDDAELICDSCDTEMQLTAKNERSNEDMMNFEDGTFELTEEDRAAMMLTLNECMDCATDAQLQAIHDYALSIAPIPQAENVDRERINELFNSINEVLNGVNAGRTPQTVAVASYKALGISLNENLAARMALIDHLNDCTTTAYQTGNMNLLENMAKVVTTIHDLIGDYDESLMDMILKKHKPESELSPWDN